MLNALITLIFNILVLASGVLFVPQIIRLYTQKRSRELSLLSFGGFFALVLFAFLHTLVTESYLLTLAFSFSVITCGATVFLIVWYRMKGN